MARTFDRVCDLLQELGYLDGDRVTPEGQRLRRLYTELDLLAAECLREGVLTGLDGPQLAAVLSSLVHESRRDDQDLAPRVPGGAVEDALHRLVRIWAGLEDRERDHRLPISGEPDAGLAWAMHRWARGQSLEAVLRDSDLAAGDFVRRCKQLVDLLGPGRRRLVRRSPGGGAGRHRPGPPRRRRHQLSCQPQRHRSGTLGLTGAGSEGGRPGFVRRGQHDRGPGADVGLGADPGQQLLQVARARRPGP